MSEEQTPYLVENTNTILPSHRYHKNKDWNAVRMELISVVNAFEPTVIDNSEEVTQRAIELLEQEVKEAKAVLISYREDNLTLNSFESEGYLRGCITCLNVLKEYL